MKEYVVLFWFEDQTMDPSIDNPFAFTCQAEDTAHAEEQCLNSYPGCVIAWVSMGMSVSETYDSYYEEM